MTRRSSDLERATGEWLDWNHFRYIRIDNYRCPKCGFIGNRRAAHAPDFLVVWPVMLGVECKTGKGKLSQGQEELREKMLDAGWDYIVCHDTVDALLEWDAKWRESKK